MYGMPSVEKKTQKTTKQQQKANKKTQANPKSQQTNKKHFSPIFFFNKDKAIKTTCQWSQEVKAQKIFNRFTDTERGCTGMNQALTSQNITVNGKD